MFGMQKNTEDDPSPTIVDRLPNTFVHDPASFGTLLGEQIDRFWPASGLNFVLCDDGLASGFFDGTFLYIFQLNMGVESYSVATCLVESAETNAAETTKLERMRQTVAEHRTAFDLNNGVSLNWSSEHELMLTHEGLPVSNMQAENMDEFEASMVTFMDAAHKILKTIVRAEKRAKKEEKSRRISTYWKQVRSSLVVRKRAREAKRHPQGTTKPNSRNSALDEKSGATEHYGSFREPIDILQRSTYQESQMPKAA